MPRRRTHGKKRYAELTNGQEWNLLLGGRTGDDCPACGIVRTCQNRTGCIHFASEDERRQAWFDHRAELMTAGNPGTRPEAWWRYEAKGRKLPDENQYEALARLGELTVEEEASFLLRGWLPVTNIATGKDPRELLR